MRRTFWVSITLGLTALLLVPLPGASAPLPQRIDSTRDRIEDRRYRESVLSDTLAGYAARIGSLEGQIGALQARQDRIQVALDRKQAELDAIRIRLDAARDRLARLRAELRIAERALAKRLVELYKADEPDVLTVVLDADGFGDLLERTEFLERVSEQDQRIVTRVRELKARIERQVEALSALEARAEAAANAILARRNELAAAKDELVRSRASLAAARDAKSASLARVRSSRVSLEGDLRQLEAEQARVQQALAAPTAAPGPVRRGSGDLIWPVSGPVTSGFGYRWGRLHAGIDIAAGTGTPIRAADSGTVALLGSVGGYGNYTCIQHTGSLSTCYAHQSGFATSQGASVSQGQVIGYVGCTGHCFGDHLHFETRVGGSPVDPLGYLF